MKRTTLISIAAAGMILSAPEAGAGINSPRAEGYFARGIEMYHDCNYNGCIDQLVQLRHFDLTPQEAEEAAYYMAMATLHSGDDEALDLLLNFLSKYPQSHRYQDVMMSVGDYQFTRGNYEDAIAEYVKVSPDALAANRSEDLIYRLAYSYMMTGENIKARPLFNKLSYNSRYGNASRFYQAYMSYTEKDYNNALSMFKTVDTSKEPGTAANYYICQIYFLYEDYEQALTLARKMIDSNEVPQFAPEVNRIAGESLYNLGSIDEALPYLWKYAAEAAEPQPSAFYMLGVSEYNSGNWENAVKLLQKAVGRTGRLSQSAYLYLGQSYVKLGNHDGALLAFEKSYTINEDPATTETAFYNYIVARMDGGRVPFGNTVAMLEDFLTRFPNSRYAANVQESIVNGYMTDNDYESALSSIRRMQNPSASVLSAKQRVLFELGTREFSAGHSDKALGYLSEATTGPSSQISRQSLLWLGDCNYNAGKFDEAAKQYLQYASTAQASDPNRTLAYYNLGYAHYKQNRYADALTDFNRVIDARPDDGMLADAYNRAGDCHYQQQEFAAAATDYRKAYDLNPSAGDYALYQLAEMHGLQQDYKGKIDGLNDLIARYPSSSLVPEALLDKAGAFSSLGDNKNAVATYQTLVRDYSSSPYGRQGYLQLAITYMSMGERNNSIETYKKLIYTYPTSDEAKIAVDDLKRIYADEGNLGNFSAFLSSIPNAPQVDASELDASAFQSAENRYVNNGSVVGVEEYLRDYPHGAFEAQALYYMAESSEAEGKYSTAEEYASEIILNHPDSEVAEDAMLIKARCESEAGKKEIALESYRKLEERASGSRLINNARLGIMRTALELGRYSEALTAIDKMKATTASGVESSSEVKFSEALALERLGRDVEARAIWSELAPNITDIYGSQSAVYLAQSQLDHGHTDEAQKTIDKFINANSPHQYWLARGFIVLSDVLRKQGNEFEANEYLRSLRSNYPGTEADIFQLIDQRLK